MSDQNQQNLNAAMARLQNDAPMDIYINPESQPSQATAPQASTSTTSSTLDSQALLQQLLTTQQMMAKLLVDMKESKHRSRRKKHGKKNKHRYCFDPTYPLYSDGSSDSSSDTEDSESEYEDVQPEDSASLLPATSNHPGDIPMRLEKPTVRPKVFYGDQRDALTFLANCRSTFTDCPTRFPTDFTQVEFMKNSMGGDAFDWAVQILRKYPKLKKNFNKFANRFMATYGMYEADRSKKSQFDQLKQKSIGKINEYICDFRRLSVFVDYTESQLVQKFIQGLDVLIREQMLVHMNSPETLDEAVVQAAKLDHYLDTCTTDPNFKNSWGYFQQTTLAQRKIKKPNVLNSVKNTPVQNTLNGVKTESVCSYCGKTGHMARNCFKRRNDKKKGLQKDITSATTLLTHETTPDTHVNCNICPFDIEMGNKNFQIQFLIDTGSTSSYLSQAVVSKFNISFTPSDSPIIVEGISGSTKVIGKTDPVLMKYKNHFNFYSFKILDLAKHEGILGQDWLVFHNTKISTGSGELIFDSEYCKSHCLEQQNLSHIINYTNDRECDEFGFFTGFQPINIPLESSFATTPGPSDLDRVPEFYQDIKEVFEEKLANELPPHRAYDCPIDLKPESTPFFGPLYSLTETEQATLKEYISENLKKGFIKPSKSSYGAPVLFVPKKDGSLRLCVDYRVLNESTIRNSYPLPLIKDLLDRVAGCSVFTKLDLPGAYNLIRIRDGDQEKTAFRTRFGLFQYEVMPFGLRNAPAVFQHFLNDILREVLDVFAYSYIDDILIFSKNIKEHHQQVKTVLKLLLKNGLYCKLKKCEFDQSRVEFLGYIISHEGISMCMDKVQSILEWPTPSCVKDIQKFMGLANFYRRFINKFSDMAKPINNLLKKDVKFVWGAIQDEVFNKLKNAFTSAPILTLPDPNKPFYVETDASNFAVGAILSQHDSENKLHPCAFYSRTLKDCETRYTVYDKELLAIVSALHEWRQHLQGAKFPFIIFSDHKNLQFAKKPEVLSDRQIRWLEFLSKFEFTIQYRPGNKNGKADALSRRPDYEGNYNLESPSLSYNNEELFCIQTELEMNYEGDPELCVIINKIRNGDLSVDPNYTLLDNCLYYQNRIVVPNNKRNQVLKNFHSTPPAGHFGIEKTYDLIGRYYHWTNMKNDISKFIKECDVCSRAKNSNHGPYGLIQISDTPTGPWMDLSVDFLTDLPVSDGFTCIMVVVDKFSKMCHLIPLLKVPDAQVTATMFMYYIFKLHGLPKSITSDQGKQFTSRFWKKFLKLLNIESQLSAPYHHASNGLAERYIATVTQYLRSFTMDDPSKWSDFVGFAEFAINNTCNSSTGKSPFQIVYGYNPTFDPNTIAVTNTSASLTTKLDWDKHFKPVYELLLKSKQKSKLFADKKRMNAPEFKVGDFVWVSPPATSLHSNKLKPRREGPFKIINKINEVTFKLDLPSTSRSTPIFHVERLELYRGRPKV